MTINIFIATPATDDPEVYGREISKRWTGVEDPHPFHNFEGMNSERERWMKLEVHDYDGCEGDELHHILTDMVTKYPSVAICWEVSDGYTDDACLVLGMTPLKWYRTGVDEAMRRVEAMHMKEQA